MKGIKYLLVGLVSISCLYANAAIFEYNSDNGNTYYTNGIPKGLTAEQKLDFKKLKRKQVDAVTPTTLSHRPDVKEIYLSDQEVPPLECPDGYEGTPPNCTEIVIDPPPMMDMPYVDPSKAFTPKVGFSELRIQPTPNGLEAPTPGSVSGGDFRIHCGPSHQAFNDPIVFPGVEGASHHHTFFGNTGTDAFSTADSLKNTGNSTCQGGITNRSAYWLPSLIDTNDGTPLEPQWALFYYKGGDVKIPNGLFMIAGDHSATKDNPQPLLAAQWQCNEQYSSRADHIPACSGDLTAIVAFPNCWDGVNLDSPDHKSHMAYDDNGVCPATHPKAISNVTGIVHYNVNGTDNLRIASDNYKGGKGGHSLHMDYMFAWDDEVLNTWWENCQIPDMDCHADLLGDGTWLY